MAFTALDALHDGYEVYPVVDAIAGTSPEAHRAGLERVGWRGGADQQGIARRAVFRLLCTFDASELVFYVDDMPVTSSSRRGGRII